MDGHLPLRIRPYVLALKQTELSGTVSVTRLPRFAKEFNLVGQGIQVTAGFDSSLNGGLLSMGLALNATISLRCERCLTDFNWQLNHRQRLFLVRKEEDIRGVSDSADFIVCENEEVEIAELIEDELLLALPQIPMHESVEECDSSTKQYLLNNKVESVHSENPFSILKKI